ncbi:class I SAM-dependent methyltransferase [Streptomyces sp. NPDC047017]|uniref:class I SAM-dependent methyltransferase n=1 Tax=Streptomyces sp. NPDC047017 TaxID=3155024 RepID=UPI0033F84C35
MRVLGWVGRAFSRVYWREEPLVDRIRPHLPAGGNVLDVGAGGCRVAELLGADGRFSVTAVDVVDHNVTEVPMRLYDGERLPFPDKSFDAALLVFVLHHAERPEALVREVLRVTRSTVVVIEDAPETRVGRWCWRAWDYVLNNAAHDDIGVAHHARNVEQWVAFLRSCGAAPSSARRFRAFYPVLRSYPHVVLPVSIDATTSG